MSGYNYVRFDACVESREDEREFGAFPNVLHAGEQASDGELTPLGGSSFASPTSGERAAAGGPQGCRELN